MPLDKDIKSKKKIAILRGGKVIHKDSLASGANLILSISKSEKILPIDVMIDEEGNWFEKGVPSDAHRVLSKADYYIDTTRDHRGAHHDLAEDLKIKHLFKNGHLPFATRTNIKRILSQTNVRDFSHARYRVFRDISNLKNELKDAWLVFHMPVVIRPNNVFTHSKSLLTYSFSEAEKYIREILKNKDEAILEGHVGGRYVSLAVVPEYRGQELYIPIPLENINKDKKDRVVNDIKIKEKYLNSHTHHKDIFSHADKGLKDKLKNITEEIYNSLSLDAQALIDFALIEKEGGDIEIKILEVHTDPHLFEDSRFESALRASGVDMAKFIEDRVERVEEETLAY
jgi:D-alanine-D-alanine ligase-like ATP-grasp enzyme